MQKCPQCGKWFKNRNAVNMHLANCVVREGRDCSKCSTISNFALAIAMCLGWEKGKLSDEDKEILEETLDKIKRIAETRKSKILMNFAQLIENKLLKVST